MCLYLHKVGTHLLAMVLMKLISKAEDRQGLNVPVIHGSEEHLLFYRQSSLGLYATHDSALFTYNKPAEGIACIVAYSEAITH